MYGVKEIGKYNVDFEGLSYDKNIPYEMVIIEEFNGDIPIQGSKKVLYFRQNSLGERKYLMPEFTDEKSVEVWLKYHNYAKIQIYNKTIAEEI